MISDNVTSIDQDAFLKDWLEWVIHTNEGVRDSLSKCNTMERCLILRRTCSLVP